MPLHLRITHRVLALFPFMLDYRGVKKYMGAKVLLFRIQPYRRRTAKVYPSIYIRTAIVITGVLAHTMR